MNEETRSCQSCKEEFKITPDDFAFYEKMEVPAPTWCPKCRLIRRMAFFNERTLYKRNCDLCTKEFLSFYPQDSNYTVYCSDCWHSDKWDPLSYGQDIDFSRPFFDQLNDLLHKVPLNGKQSTALENSEYSLMSSYLKNCYLVFNSDYNENCMYATYLERSKNCLDILMSDLCELCYGSSYLYKDYNVRYSRDCNECFDVSFSRNLIGCSNCFGCVNLRNKQFYIFNKPYTEEEYKKEMAKFDLGSHRFVEETKKKVASLLLTYPRKHVEGLNNEDTTGDYIFNSKKTFQSHQVTDVEDSKWCHFLFIASTKDSYDYTMWGGGSERMYECMGCGVANNVRFSLMTWMSQTNLEYTTTALKGGDDLFGCVSVQKKRFCILNKQYSEKDFHELRKKLIEHMNTMPYKDSRGREFKYGEYFPLELSQFGYNETIAQVHFPLTKEEALAQGFKWRDEKEANYKPTLQNNVIPDRIQEVQDSITQAVIECEHKGACNHQCTGVYKITTKELKFYRDQVIPLPRLCGSCRHYERVVMGNPIAQLWKQKCHCKGQESQNKKYKNNAVHPHGKAPCENQFHTSYAPDRQETVYCEQCYQAEVA